jgi:hypothetical protein
MIHRIPHEQIRSAGAEALVPDSFGRPPMLHNLHDDLQTAPPECNRSATRARVAQARRDISPPGWMSALLQHGPGG